MQENLWERINVMYSKHKARFFDENIFAEPLIDWAGVCQGLIPCGLHLTMFRLSIENLANEEQ